MDSTNNQVDAIDHSLLRKTLLVLSILYYGFECRIDVGRGSPASDLEFETLYQATAGLKLNCFDDFFTETTFVTHTHAVKELYKNAHSLRLAVRDYAEKSKKGGNPVLRIWSGEKVYPITSFSLDFFRNKQGD